MYPDQTAGFLLFAPKMNVVWSVFEYLQLKYKVDNIFRTTILAG